MCFLNSSSLSNHPLQSFQTQTVSPFTKANNKQTFSVWWGAGIFLGIWATTKKANKWEAGQYYSPLAKVQAFIKRCPLNASAPSGEGSIEAQQLWRECPLPVNLVSHHQVSRNPPDKILLTSCCECFPGHCPVGPVLYPGLWHPWPRSNCATWT